MNRKVIPLNNTALEIPLLETKIVVPRILSGLVDRPRIHTRLDALLQGKLALVTAPAGFGKTCAVAQWVGQKGFPVAWLSLDVGDNDPVRFWTYVAAALRGVHEDMGARMAPMLRSSTSPPWEAAISLLIDDLSRLPFDLALVLDDYHVISEPIVHETLSFLVRYAPDHFHPVIAGRTEPPLPLPRLRTAGLVTELTARDLDFSVDEVAAFYKQRNIDLTGEEVEKLAERTGGWAAGMQMAAMSLVESDDKAVTIKRFGGADRLLAGYFMDEVFALFDAQVQEFLMQTSILDHLSGPLCQAVTGRPDSVTILTEVGRACGFVASLADQWHVYHQLFAEFLREVLKTRHPDRIRRLYARAAGWYEDAGLTVKAVDYFLQGAEYGQAARLVERLVPEMMDRGETATLFRWLQVLPPEEVGQSLPLCVAQAWAAVYADRTDEVEHWLDRADASCRDAHTKAGDGGKSIAMDMAVIRAFLAVKRRDVPGTLDWLTQAEQAPEKVFTYGRSSVLQPWETSLLGGPLGWFGHLNDKARAMESGAYLKMRGLAQPAGRAGYTLVANGEALYEWNKIDAAIKSLVEGLEEAERAQEAGALVPALVTLVKIHLARGDLAAALAATAQGEKKTRDLGRPNFLFPLTALKARLHLAAGDTQAFNAWLAQSRLDIYDRLSAARAYEHITLARVLQARGNREESLLLLERLRVFAEKEKRLPQTIEVLNLLAIANDAVGRTAEGLEIFRQNLALGRDNGYLRSFIDEGEPLLVLLRRLVRSRKLTQGEADYARHCSPYCVRAPCCVIQGCEQCQGGVTLSPPGNWPCCA